MTECAVGLGKIYEAPDCIFTFTPREETACMPTSLLKKVMVDRIAEKFAAVKADNRTCFVAYLCAGDPDFATSLEACRALIEGGIDILELGVPFSDPLADGLTNQLAAERALNAGMTQALVLELVREIRKFSDIPIVLYTYYNLIFSQGESAYIEAIYAAGVDGVLTLDLPPEEASSWLASCEQVGIKTVFIVAPTTPESRIAQITNSASGFIYYVSRTGVTGERAQLPDDLAVAVKRIQSQTTLPVVVGFGISTAAHVRAVSAVADGVVVGSSLVNCIADHSDNPDAAVDALKTKIATLLA